MVYSGRHTQLDEILRLTNPLRNLSFTNIVEWLEEGERGAFSNLQWFYRSMEQSEPILLASIKRVLSAIEELDWSVRIRDDAEDKGKMAEAEAQKEILDSTYEAIMELDVAIRFLAMADFRGFAHLEKIWEDNQLKELVPVPQWHWVLKEGKANHWAYLSEADLGSEYGGQIVPRDKFVIRQTEHYVDRAVVASYLRKSFATKDWAQYVEYFGIPRAVVGVPAGAQDHDKWFEQAKRISQGNPGVLPAESTVSWPNLQSGTDPFEKMCRYLDEQIVLSSTNGMLTVLPQSGSGTLAGGAHAEAFRDLSRATASKISAIFQRDVDEYVLRSNGFDGEIWAYFSLEYERDRDSTAVADMLKSLREAGVKVGIKELQERIGWSSLEEVEPGILDLSGVPKRQKDEPGIEGMKKGGVASQADTGKGSATRRQKVAAGMSNSNRVWKEFFENARKEKEVIQRFNLAVRETVAKAMDKDLAGARDIASKYANAGEMDDAGLLLLEQELAQWLAGVLANKTKTSQAMADAMASAMANGASDSKNAKKKV